jgi:hypothetical protein
MVWAYSKYRRNKKNAYKILIEFEAKELLEGIEEDERTIFKMALIKLNAKGGKYIHLAQRADNELYNTAIYLHVP